MRCWTPEGGEGMGTNMTQARNPTAVPGDTSAPPWIEHIVAEALQIQRGHALLLHGPQGIGQWEFAMALARAWLCEAREQPDAPACGYCASCRLVDQRGHPDLRLIVPETFRGDAGLPVDEGGGEDSKKRKPSREIKVDQIREALGFSELTAGRGALKVVVVHPAEAVNAVAANALLKTLEEPQGAMRFVLTTSAPHLLLPTIRSRCQAVRLDVPPTPIAQAWLVSQGVAAADVSVLLAVAGGQPQWALEHVRQGRTAAVWRDFPQAVLRQDSAAWSAWPLSVLVDALQRLAHDAMLAAQGLPGRYFERLPPLERRMTPLLAWSRELTSLSRQADHPWHAALSLDAVVQRAARALTPPTAARGARG